MIYNYPVTRFKAKKYTCLLPLIAASIFFIGSIRVSAQSYWMQRGGGASDDEAYSIATDGSNTYTTGYFTGTATFGSYNLSASGVSDIFVAKTNSSGVYLWAVKAGDGGPDRGLAIASDASGNSYVTGYYYGTATFGIHSITSAGLQDVFIAKYDNTGAVQWVVSCGGSQSDIGSAIAVDNNGNVIVTGQFTGTATFGTYTLTSRANNINVFTTKLNASTGAFVWAESGVGAHTDWGIGVACDPSGNVYVTGQFTDTITFTNPLYSPLNSAIFVVKYNSSGIEQWVTSAGGGTSNIANGIAVDNSSNAYITGNFTGTLTFYANSIVTLTQTYSNRIFVAKYDQSGNLVWDVADGSNNPLVANAIAVDGSGNPYIIGNFECVMNSYADHYGQGTFNTVGYWDIFNAEYSTANGAWQWSRQIAGHGNNYGYGIAISGGKVADAGSFDQDTYITDNPGNFLGYNAATAGCTPSYCSDPNYGDYEYFITNGGLDAFIAEPIDLTRQTYDFYNRTGNSCNRPVVSACIGTGNICQDTAKFCISGTIQVVPNECIPGIGPNTNFLWSTGAQSSSISVSSTGTYSVTETSQDGCLSSSGSIYVVINPPPSAPTISDNVVINTNSSSPLPIRVCEKSVTLTAGNYAGNASWYWTYLNNPRLNATSVTIPYPPSDSGNYCFTVVDKYGCINQTCVWVAIDGPLPNLDPALKCITCSHDTAFLCKGQGFTILPYDVNRNPLANPDSCLPDVLNAWSIINDTAAYYNRETACLGQNVIVPNAWDSGWFKVADTVIESNVCGAKKYIINDSVFARIYPVPIINLSVTGGTSLCPGDFEWIKGSGNVPFVWSNGSTQDSIYVSIGGYSISASQTNKYGCNTVATAGISISTFVPLAPTITMNPSSGVICPKDSVRLDCVGGPYQYFEWYGPSGPLPIDDSIAYVKVPGNYYCVATDSTPCYISKLSTTVQVESYSTPYLQLPAKTNLCPGDSLTLLVVASNSAIIQWQPPLSGDSTVQVIKSPGTYSVKITSCGITTLCTTTITSSSPHASIAALPSKTLCTAGDSVKLSGLPRLSNYAWTPGNANTQIMYVKQAGTYSLSTVDTFGCSASADITIAPPVRDSIVKTINVNCTGDKTGLITLGVKGGAPPYKYTWAPPQGSSASASDLSAGSYTITVSDSNGCVKTASVSLTQPAKALATTISSVNIKCYGDLTGSVTANPSGGQTPYTYVWAPGGETTAAVTGIGIGVYSVMVIDANACTATTSAILTEPLLLSLKISEPLVICKDSTGTLVANVSGGVVPYTYAWSTGNTSSSIIITPTSNRDYSVMVTDANGCTATEQVTLQYGTPFTVILRGNNTFCSGDSTTLCATAINTTYGATYLWQPGNNNSTCITIAPAVPTTYTLTVIDGCGATTTADVHVYPYPTPVANMNAISSQGCAPFCVQFYNASTILQSKIRQYVWDFGDGDTSHSQSPVYCYPTAGTYNVSLTVISDSGCSSTLSRKSMINVFSPPRAAFSFTPQPTSILSPTIQFTDKSTDASGITYWWWTFGDTSDSSSHKPNPVHTYQDTGNYCPTLVVMNTKGCTDTTTNCLVIEPIFSLYIPSAFSPNSDGLNDVFKPIGEYISHFEMYIFDRWGMELYHTTDINEGWNGTAHGSSAVLQEDVYIYRIIVTDSQGNQHSYIGNVTLLK